MLGAKQKNQTKILSEKKKNSGRKNIYHQYLNKNLFLTILGQEKSERDERHDFKLHVISTKILLRLEKIYNDRIVYKCLFHYTLMFFPYERYNLCIFINSIIKRKKYF